MYKNGEGLTFGKHGINDNDGSRERERERASERERERERLCIH